MTDDDDEDDNDDDDDDDLDDYDDSLKCSTFCEGYIMQEGRNFLSCVVETSTDNCHLGIYSTNLEEML